MRNKMLVRFAVAALVLAALAACDKYPSRPLVFGANVWAGYEPVYLARELNYYDPAKVHLAEYSNASEVIRAFRNHLIQAAGVTLDEALLMQQDIPDLRIIMVFDYSSGADVVLGQPEFHTLQQLKGRRVGVENTALGAYFLSLALDSAGMTPQQIKIVPLSVDNHANAFHTHSVDAVVTFEPVRTQLLRDDRATLLFDSSRVPGKIVDVLVTRTEYLQRYPDELRMLVQGWGKALAYMHTDSEQSMRIMAMREGVSAQEFKNILTGITLTDLANNRILLSDGGIGFKGYVESMQDYLLQQRLLRVKTDTAALVDASLIESVP